MGWDFLGITYLYNSKAVWGAGKGDIPVSLGKDAAGDGVGDSGGGWPDSNKWT